jgi:hypothetical protein
MSTEWLEWEVAPHTVWVLVVNQADIGVCEEVHGVFTTYEAAYEYAATYPDDTAEVVEWEVLQLKEDVA